MLAIPSRWNTIVGTYNKPGGFGSFVYNGSSFSEFSYPGAQLNTHVQGISGNQIVGYYGNGPYHGFLYNGSSFVTLDDPLAAAAGAAGQTFATGVSGRYVVGWYSTDGGNTDHGFVYDGSSFTTLDDPLGLFGTQIMGISGNTIVGTYDYQGSHGFITQIPEPSSLILVAVGGPIVALQRFPDGAESVCFAANSA